MKTQTIFAYLDGEFLEDVVEMALEENLMVEDAKKILIAAHFGHVVTFEVAVEPEDRRKPVKVDDKKQEGKGMDKVKFGDSEAREVDFSDKSKKVSIITGDDVHEGEAIIAVLDMGDKTAAVIGGRTSSHDMSRMLASLLDALAGIDEGIVKEAIFKYILKKAMT